ncbi:hypothetical protein SAMN05216276_1009167 [Streptosporangium subroseum]|uniref:Uncharacterized protein n=1 Tax=Streptosporangium subroseum TaxID=106412 RepID=A0A239EKM1_9ACTN|nr:hypothetical protein SAMN05216276_1009167 [Streptosporangium subroseum]
MGTDYATDLYNNVSWQSSAEKISNSTFRFR